MSLQERGPRLVYARTIGHDDRRPWTEPQRAALEARLERLGEAYDIGRGTIRLAAGDLVLTIDNLTAEQHDIVERWLTGESYLLDD